MEARDFQSCEPANMTNAPYQHSSFLDAVSVLEGRFVSKDDEYQKFCHIDIISQRQNKEGMMIACSDRRNTEIGLETTEDENGKRSCSNYYL